jgi:hypothetical protein
MCLLFFGDRLLSSVIPLAKISDEFMLIFMVRGKLNCV